MSLTEVLQYLVTFLKEKPIGKEYYAKTADGYAVSLFWHEPSLNLGEGTENPDYWYDLAVRAIEKLCKWEGKRNVL